jgi:hypothetical protein
MLALEAGRRKPSDSPLGEQGAGPVWFAVSAGSAVPPVRASLRAVAGARLAGLERVRAPGPLVSDRGW